jgi:hypothetical protein
MPKCRPALPHDLKLKAKILPESGMCVYCGDETRGRDHFHPVVGPDGLPTGYCEDIWNIVTACPTCNSSKGNRSWLAFMKSTTPKSPRGRGCPDWKLRLARLNQFAAAGRTRAQKWDNHGCATALRQLRQALTKQSITHAQRLKRVLDTKPVLPKQNTAFSSRKDCFPIHAPLKSVMDCSKRPWCVSVCLAPSTLCTFDNDCGSEFTITLPTHRKHAACLLQNKLLVQPVQVVRSWKFPSDYSPNKGYLYAGAFIVTKRVKKNLYSTFTLVKQ